MKTYTKKISKNGRINYYSLETGKRISKATALDNERKAIAANGTVAEKFDTARDIFRIGWSDNLQKFGWYDTGNNFGCIARLDWHNVDDDIANDELGKFFGLTVEEFKAEFNRRFYGELKKAS